MARRHLYRCVCYCGSSVTCAIVEFAFGPNMQTVLPSRAVLFSGSVVRSFFSRMTAFLAAVSASATIARVPSTRYSLQLQ